MDSWLAECKRLVWAAMGEPAGEIQTVVMWTIAVVTLMLVMRGTSAALNVQSMGWARDLLATLVGVLVAVGAAGIASQLLVPAQAGPWVRRAMLMGAALVGAAAVGAPLQALLMRCKYGNALSSFVTALGVTLLLLFVVQTIIGSASAGKKASFQLRRHNVETREFLNAK
jgi:hypothetical protein